MDKTQVDIDKSNRSPTQAAATDEDDIVQSSQPDDGAESQPILPLSQTTELQGSGDTMLSQDSVTGEAEGNSLNLGQQDTKEESHVGNSSLEVEANNSTRENSSHQTPDKVLAEEEDLFSTQGRNFSEEYSCAEHQIPDTKKRKCDSSDSPAEWKKPKLGDVSERQHSIEMVFESERVKKEDSVVDISSSSERIVLDDSEDYSLRIEESTQPTCPDESTRISQETEGLTSFSDVDKPRFPNSQSEKSTESNSWNFPSMPDNCQKCTFLKKENEGLRLELRKLKNEKASLSSFSLEDSNKNRSSLEHSSGQVSLENNSKHDASTQEVYLHLVKVDHKRECYAVGDVILQSDIADKTVKSTNVVIKAVSLAGDYHADCAKPSPRMSIMSTTSFKSSSSTGSVGLPGPFALPGRKRTSIQSTISSSSSASSGFHNGRDARILKHVSPMSEAKSKVSVKCCHCNLDFPPVPNFCSPLVNGSPQSLILEHEVKDLKEKVVPPLITTTNRRGRKATKNTSSSDDTLTGSQQKESSSSGSQPQNSSTTTLSPAIFPKPRGRPRKTPFPVANSPCIEASTSSPAPKTSTPIRPPSSLIRQTSTSSSERSLNSAKGEPVLAWWSDGRWYPGWVKEGLQEAEGEVLVHYCDGHRKTVPRSKVVSASKIVPGTLVLALANSREYEEALVVNVTVQGEEPMYHVERDNVTKDVQFSSIAVLDSQILEITTTQTQKGAAILNFNDVSLENIVSQPRKRSAKMSFEELARGRPARKKKRAVTPPPSTSHGHIYGPPEDNCPDTDSSTHSTCSVDLRGKEVKPLDIECSPPEDSQKKLCNYRQDMAIKSEKKQDHRADPFAELYGPMPEKGSELFSDCSFLTTHTSQVELQHDLGEVAVSDFCTEDREYLPMLKERLRKQIRNGGGRTYKSLHQVPKDERDSLYLISDKPCNTPMYLQCIVENIPIYSSDIIIQCCKQNKRFMDVIAQRGVKRLPAGYSLSKKTMVQPRANPGKLLRKKRLLLALSADPSITEFWARLIKKLGGLSEPYSNPCFEDGRYDIVVTDKDCDPDLVELACKQDLPLVSLTWLQQCIITGDCRSYTEHPLYKYNCASTAETSPEY